jgi:hypothetical protein
MLTHDLEQREVVTRKDFPFLLLRSDFFNKMFESLIKNYGQAGKAMMFSMGRDLGAGKVKELMDSAQWFDAPQSESEIIDKVFVKLNHMGWGRFHVESFDPFKKHLQLSVRSTPFIEKNSADSNGYPFLQGVIVGITSEIFEKEMSISDPSNSDQQDGVNRFEIVANTPKVVN